MKNTKIATIIGVLVVGFCGGWIFGTYKQSQTLQNFSDVSFSQTNNVGVISSQEISTQNTKEYTNKNHSFSLSHPKELDVKEYDEGGNSETVTFQRGSDLYGFQIFITPYKEKEITKERIAKDIPSQKVIEPVEVIIGSGVRALSFLSTNSFMGETREVWFIKDGFLYEVTTYKALDVWLAGILGTLKFK